MSLHALSISFSVVDLTHEGRARLNFQKGGSKAKRPEFPSFSCSMYAALKTNSSQAELPEVPQPLSQAFPLKLLLRQLAD